MYFDQALNCTRLLARVIPIMLETDSKFVMDLFWSKQVVSTPGRADAEGDKGEAGVEDPPATQTESEPLAVILINAMFHLLFLPDFTIEDPNVDFNDEDVKSQQFKNALMWSPGVGSVEKTVVGSSQYDLNRIDVLRLMVAAFCDSLYQHPDSYDCCQSYWLEVGTSADVPYAEIVFYSLINTVLGKSVRYLPSFLHQLCNIGVVSFPSGYDPIGWGLPYGNLVAVDTAKPLMELAVQVLIILLDYGHPIKPTSESEADAVPHVESLPYVAADATESRGFNVFRRILSSIHAPDQLNFIFRGFARLLNNVHQSESSYLPFSVTRIGIEQVPVMKILIRFRCLIDHFRQELMVLLWKCLEEIPPFMPYILR